MIRMGKILAKIGYNIYTTLSYIRLNSVIFRIAFVNIVQNFIETNNPSNPIAIPIFLIIH